MTKQQYSVWVGGVEVNDYYLTQEMADAIAELFNAEGYNDVVVEVAKVDGKSKPSMLR